MITRTCIFIAFMVWVGVPVSVFAQLATGTMQLGGNIGYTKSNLNDRPLKASAYEKQSLIVLPRAGYFISPVSALGLGLGYMKTSVMTEESASVQVQDGVRTNRERIKIKQDLFIINPYWRVHKPLSESFVLFLEVEAAYGLGKGKVEQEYRQDTYPPGIIGPGVQPVQSLWGDQEMDTKQMSWGAGLSPGLIFFPSAKWGIDLSVGILGYTQVKTKTDRIQTDSDLNLLTNLSNVSVGARYYLLR